MSSMDLTGKSAIVTGGSRGIGEATALAFAEAGAKVAVMGRKLEPLQEVVAKIESKGGKGLALQAHVARPDEVGAAVRKAVQTFGELDILVNNAATNPHFGPLIDCSNELWDKIFEVNLKGCFLVTKSCVPFLEKTGGCIVNVASVAGLKPFPLMGVYAVTKAGMIHLTKILAKELGPRKIRVNCVAPGVIKTRFSKAIWENEAILDEILKGHAIDRIGEPEEVASAIMYLASKDSAYTTGTVLVLDGGEML
ncbi:MAG: SDR family oxidoreductase [Deltaproteobacteria bacterium]|nr:SDR family oxidoreductase [Deltaproteobacteria bacterium]